MSIEERDLSYLGGAFALFLFINNLFILSPWLLCQRFVGYNFWFVQIDGSRPVFCPLQCCRCCRFPELSFDSKQYQLELLK